MQELVQIRLIINEFSGANKQLRWGFPLLFSKVHSFGLSNLSKAYRVENSSKELHKKQKIHS